MQVLEPIGLASSILTTLGRYRIGRIIARRIMHGHRPRRRPGLHHRQRHRSRALIHRVDAGVELEGLGVNRDNGCEEQRENA